MVKRIQINLLCTILFMLHHSSNVYYAVNYSLSNYNKFRIIIQAKIQNQTEKPSYWTKWQVYAILWKDKGT